MTIAIETAASPAITPVAAPRARVLVVDDQPELLRLYARILHGAGYAVSQAADGRAAIARLTAEPFDVVLTDISMPGMSGIDLLRAIRGLDLEIPVLLVTAAPSVDSAIDALEHGALRYLIKPIAPRALLDAVARATKLGQLTRIKKEAIAYLASLARSGEDRPAQAATLGRALATLWMAYQPIVNWGGQRIVAFEALVRTEEPDVPHPGALFGLAERLGAVHEVGRAVRASVARTLAADPPAVDVFVNLHPSDLMDDDLYSPAAPLTAFAGRVVLEVTEREALDERAGVAARADRLRALGYRLAIDDLGAGYAGLTYFARLKPEVVKIDMSLVRGIDLEPIKQKLVGSLVTLCRDLGMTIVAEGIETAAERDTVVALGCELLQGYLFARPGRPFPAVSW